MDERSIDMKAEVYCLTAFLEQAAGYEGFFLECLGTKERGRNKDVLGLKPKHSVLGQKVIELLGIQVSRNGIYHLLPETLFQPLTLGTTASNTYEIVAEIRKNREREDGNRLFFIPFDTEFFHCSAALVARQLGWPMKREGAARQLLAELAGQDLGYGEDGSLLLLSFFANAERAKDNAPLLADFLAALLGLEVRIKEQHIAPILQLPIALGSARLGVETVLSGLTAYESQDWVVEIVFSDAEALADAATEGKIEKRVQTVLDYFVLATREVRVELKAQPEACSTVMGQGILGLNLQLSLQVA